MKKYTPLLAIIFLLYSCTKERTQEKHSMGVVEDTQENIKKAKRYYSKGFISDELAKGRPPKKWDTLTPVPPPPPTATVDILNPTVSIYPMAKYFNVNDIVTIKAQVLDNVGVVSVWLSIDEQIIETTTNYQPTFIWNTTGVQAGVHTIKVSGKDRAGNIGSSFINVNIDAVIIPDTTLPSKFTLATPPVINQGSEGSCVGMTVGYYARSIEQYYKTKATSYSQSTNILSPECLYNQIKADVSCLSGASLLGGVNFVISKGICTFASMPYSYQNGCSTLPNAIQSTEALNYTAKFYSSVRTADILGIKTMLYNKHPLMFTFGVDYNFNSAGPTTIIKSRGSEFYGVHAITIVGYDDSKHAFKVINSWGTGWGDAGFTWIDYDYLQQMTYEAFIMNI